MDITSMPQGAVTVHEGGDWPRKKGRDRPYWGWPQMREALDKIGHDSAALRCLVAFSLAGVLPLQQEGMPTRKRASPKMSSIATKETHTYGCLVVREPPKLWYSNPTKTPLKKTHPYLRCF